MTLQGILLNAIENDPRISLEYDEANDMFYFELIDRCGNAKTILVDSYEEIEGHGEIMVGEIGKYSFTFEQLDDSDQYRVLNFTNKREGATL